VGRARRRRSASKEADAVWPDVILLDSNSAVLAVARRMIRAGARVTAIAEPGAWEVRSRGVRPILAPFGADGEAWLQCLQAETEGHREAVLLPASDRASELLVRSAARLPEHVHMFERAARGHLALMDKARADAIARRASVAVPYTATISSPDDVARAVAGAPWPCVVKPVFSHVWRAQYSQERVFLAHSAADVARLVERPLAAGMPMLLNQYVPGGDTDVEEAIVVRLADGSYPIRFGCHKLRQCPLGFGSTTLGLSEPLAETMELAQRVLDEAGFVGVAGVETKRDPATGRRWFLEVNVRLPGQWGLGDACGAQATPRLVAALSGRPLGPAPPARTGVHFVEPVGDAKACLELLSGVPAWRWPLEAWRRVRPYFGPGELGLLDLRDPGPAIACIRRIVGRRITTRARAVLGHLRPGIPHRASRRRTRRAGAKPWT
jgi:D-aspartate ligase